MNSGYTSRILTPSILDINDDDDDDEEEENDKNYQFAQIKGDRLNCDFVSPIPVKSANSFTMSSTSLISTLSPRHQSGYLRSNFSMKSWREV